MKTILKVAGPVLALAFSAGAYAVPAMHATPEPVTGLNDRYPQRVQDAPNVGNIAPEVDPSLAIGGLTLLAGTLTVMRSRRRN